MIRRDQRMNDDTPSRLSLAVGEKRAVPLRALATAGYQWSQSVSGPDPTAIAVEIHRGELPPGTPPGRSAPEEAIVHGLHPGQATVRLQQRRPWERDQPPADTLDLHIEVR
jgi:predicted secreted protein